MDKKEKAAKDRNTPYVVTHELIEEYRAITEDMHTVLEVDHTLGNGYGVEPNGYKLTHIRALVELSVPCECGHMFGSYEYSAGSATCSPAAESTECNECGREISSEQYPP